MSDHDEVEQTPDPSSLHPSRRTVLRGVGATLALPMLDAMIPARTALAATAAAAKPRVGGHCA